MIRLVALLPLLFVSADKAADWRVIFQSQKDNAGVVIYVDLVSIGDNPDGTVRAEMFGATEQPRDGIWALESGNNYDCQNARARMVSYKVFGAGGEVVRFGTRDAAPWRPAGPDNSGETVLKFACSHGASKPDVPKIAGPTPFAAARSWFDSRAKR